VSHGDDFDFVTSEHVHQAEGKSREDVTPGASSMARPGTWVLGDSIDGVP
jgi:hypothetical protein